MAVAAGDTPIYNPAILLKQVPETMPGVFISYRREDSAAYAGRLFDLLSGQFGAENTFMDVDDIKGGDNFVTVIDRNLDVSDALLAVIGPRWLSVTEPDGGTRRLDNPRDFVRVEIARALQRGIRVIPVLVGGAALPRPADLPAELQPLCDRQAMEVRDTHFYADGKDLTDVLRAKLGSGVASPRTKLKRLVPVLATAVAAMLVAMWVLSAQSRKGASSEKGDAAQRTQTSSSAGASDSSRQPQANVAGEWEATVKYDWGDTYHEWFAFQVDGQDVSGTAGFLGTGQGQGRPIWEGKIAGDRLSFMTKTLTNLSGNDKTYEDKHYYQGTLKGDTIEFTMVTDSSVSSHTAIHFTAHRVK
jgi:hypothetical protein